VTISTTKMTARQFFQLGDDPAGVRLELVNGEVAVSPSPTPNHGYTVIKLATLLENHVAKRKLGQLFLDLDTVLGSYDVRRPDILFFTRQRAHLIGDDYLEQPPDLCVEVVSPSSVKIDRRDKFKQYQGAGITYYWIVDPAERTFEAFQLKRKKYVRIESGKDADAVSVPPFPDLKIALAKLWRPRN
jgi:Uma2 family endonuclease